MELLFLIFAFFVFLLILSFKKIPKGSVGIVNRMGQEMPLLEPGYHIILPFIDKLIIEKR